MIKQIRNDEMVSTSTHRPRVSARGFTLVEVLVAIVLTLILLGLMIRAFSVSGAEIAKGRALLEISGQLRSTTELLRSDLSGVTATMISRNQFGSGTGYFEYIEGPTKDKTVHNDHRTGAADTSGVYGDVDDILMFTARSKGQPFRGRWGGQTIESNYAEIIWWTVFEDSNGNNQFDSHEPLRLYRRVLLIRPDLSTTVTDLDEFWQFNDISVRQLSDLSIHTNSLSDLSDRANRFARAGTPFPHEPVFPPNVDSLQGSERYVIRGTTSAGTVNLSEGEDIQLTQVVAFDVRAYDPVVEVKNTQGLDPNVVNPLEIDPTDFRADLYTAAPVSGFGSYVDLNIDGFMNGYAVGPYVSNGIFSAGPRPPAPDDPVDPMTGRRSTDWTINYATYCTWSMSYETDGLDTDKDGPVDEGKNSLDDNAEGGPDDVDEYETQPPYPYPLRGIKVIIRVAEPTTQIVRQTSVIANFVPE